ncbi:MAG: SRPBCC family protein [Flavobacteriales bacterium]|nr:SRPBCC family protein [Flavobacteriales bacterium]
MSIKVAIKAHGERATRITRSFNAPRTLVFDAMSNAEMMKHWFHGAPGWTLTTCEIDLRVGGRYRWVWTNEAGQEMGMGGEYKEVKRPERIVTTEKFDQAWYPGEAIGTIELSVQGKQTLMTLTVEYESRAARDGVLAIPMESEMESGYQRLDAYLAKH